MVTRGLYSYLKNGQKLPIKALKKVFHGTQQNFLGQSKGSLGSKGSTWAERIDKSNTNYQVKLHKGSTFFQQKTDTFWPKFPSWGS